MFDREIINKLWPAVQRLLARERLEEAEWWAERIHAGQGAQGVIYYPIVPEHLNDLRFELDALDETNEGNRGQ